MHYLSQKFITLLFAVAFVLLPSLSHADNSSNSMVVTNIEGGGWITRDDPAVHSTVSVGDVIQKGDNLDVKRGSSVQMSMDASGQNILEVKGGKMEYTTEEGTKIDFKEGEVFAFLDNYEKDNKFEVRTPSTVASVRGTRFHMLTHDAGAEVSTLKGSVMIQAVDKKYTFRDFLRVVDGGEKVVNDTDKDLAKTTVLTEEDLEKFEDPLKKTNETRSTLEENPEWLENKVDIANDSKIHTLSPEPTQSVKLEPTFKYSRKGYILI